MAKTACCMYILPRFFPLDSHSFIIVLNFVQDVSMERTMNFFLRCVNVISDTNIEQTLNS